jgi:hypothetical protein
MLDIVSDISACAELESRVKNTSILKKNLFFKIRTSIFMFLFLRSHCECDMQFRRCLQSVGSSASHALGALYFNIARVPCFSEVRQPTRVARLGYDTGCDGPYSQWYEPKPYAPSHGKEQDALESPAAYAQRPARAC